MTYFPEAQDVQAAFASVVVDEWARAGVTDVVACPGSRSTPILVALAEAAERGRLTLHVMLDERSAGYFALGLGLAGGRPAPVVTPSGTAAAELHPAVVEAHHAGVAFLAVTGDRPEELQDCGAPQTIDQEGLFGRAVRWSASPGVAELAASSSWRSLASRSVAEASGGAHRPGPVHLNLAFREPLVGSATPVLGPALEGRAQGRPWHHLPAVDDLRPPVDLVAMLASAGARGLVVAGRGAIGTPEGVLAVKELSRVTSWPVLADPLSGCRYPGVVAGADALLRTGLARQWEPDVVVRLGAPWASRVLNEWLSGLGCPQVLVDRWGAWAAPDHRPTEVVVASPGAFCRDVAAAVAAVAGVPGDWHRRWVRAEKLAQEAIDATVKGEVGLTEPGVARAVVASLPMG